MDLYYNPKNPGQILCLKCFPHAEAHMKIPTDDIEWFKDNGSFTPAVCEKCKEN